MDKNYNSTWTGLDRFTPDCDTEEKIYCRACGSKMDIQRRVHDYRSWSDFTARIKSYFDVFTCPNSGKPWHDQVIALKIEISKTASTKIERIIQEEIDYIKQ